MPDGNHCPAAHDGCIIIERWYGEQPAVFHACTISAALELLRYWEAAEIDQPAEIEVTDGSA